MAIDTTARHLHHRVPRAVLESVTSLYFRFLLPFLFYFPIPYAVLPFSALILPLPTLSIFY